MTKTAAALRDVIVRAGISLSLLWKETDYLDNFARAVQEALWNGRDAGGTQLNCQFVKNGRETDLVIWDNGVGISDDGLPAIVQILNSPSAKDSTKRGKRGSGAKAFCRHARRLTVQTLRPGESHLLEICYTTEELVDMMHERREATWKRCEVSAGHRLKGSGACFIWHGLGTGDVHYVNPKHPRTVEVLLVELPELLQRDVAKMVTIVDEKGKRHRLTPRTIAGERIELSDTLPGLGQVSCDITVTPGIEPLERLTMWAFDPGCTLGAFLRHVRRTASIAAFLPAVNRLLDHPQVVGQISIPAWKPYILRATDAGFRQDLYDDGDAIFAFVEWLFLNVVPKVEKILGSKSEVAADADELCSTLVAQFQAISEKPADTTPVLDLSALLTEPARLTLECGKTMRVRIAQPTKGGTYEWDDSRAPVTVNPRRGTEVTITAGATPGRGKVVQRLSGQTRDLQVEVAERLLPAFTYSMRGVTVGQVIRHTLAHTQHVRGRPTWEIAQGHGILETLPDNPFEVKHRVPDMTGTYEVTARMDLDDGASLVLKVVILATEPGGKTPVPRNPRNTEFRLEGHTYTILPRPFADQAEVIASYREPISATSTRIMLNLNHPLFKGAEALTLRAAQIVVSNEIALDEARRDPKLARDTADISRRASAIFANLASKNKQS